MLNLCIQLATNTFQQFSKVTQGGLFIIHGLIATVESRIAPYVPTFMDYLLCSMRMENCDGSEMHSKCDLEDNIDMDRHSALRGVRKWQRERSRSNF